MPMGIRKSNRKVAVEVLPVHPLVPRPRLKRETGAMSDRHNDVCSHTMDREAPQLHRSVVRMHTVWPPRGDGRQETAGSPVLTTTNVM